MTTTLRPTGPEERDAAGGRSRRYAISVNGRPAGRLHLAADPGGSPVGRVLELVVDPADRRRGRGTAAALAAEEVLRGWGCTSLEARLDAGATAAHGLADQLGWVERSRNMVKEVAPDASAPPLPAGERVREMTAAEYPQWLATEREDYVRAWTDRGLPPVAAARRADSAYTRLLAEGPVTPGTVLRVLEAGGERAGALWVRNGGDLPDGAESYVYSVAVAPEHRGRGLGRALMLEAERVCAAAGLSLLGLHVFADNTPARRLYDSLGYRTIALNTVKPLG
ncbi:GNAT family N-acetyltransferase [Streptomyces bohaiensis]|uniref:GNAT family N-acetyltransferase n=1 Tax=Streptomyces bohaiensis TaxID=1431344 RepID=A0ABX1CAJ7_9ACTN|nr:GNAT family N-acetyltransferase [Streptomyces bohaiensis]NJQ16126.1 GNAT family N-acetyltransferase [Streptomyces bohaiensis]